MTSSIRTGRPAARRHRLGADVSTPNVSRDLARSALADPRWALDERTRGDVVVIVNELVTASYLAGAGTIDLAIEVQDDQVVVAVRDDRPLDRPTATSGRGTRELLLDALSTYRTVSHDAEGTVNVVHLLLRHARPARHLSLVR